MEAAQDAQAVLGTGPPRFVLALVQPVADKRTGRQALGGLLAAGVVGGLALLRLPPWMLWAVGGLGLLGWLLARLLGGHDWLPAPAPHRAVSRLLVFADQLVLETGGAVRAYPLDARTRIVIRYQGYRGEHLAPRSWASGIHNFIQLNDAPAYAFEVPHAARASVLAAELRKWYARRVQLREYRQGGPTFLLARSLSYEQLQAYKQEFGVSLYG